MAIHTLSISICRSHLPQTYPMRRVSTFTADRTALHRMRYSRAYNLLVASEWRPRIVHANKRGESLQHIESLGSSWLFICGLGMQLNLLISTRAERRQRFCRLRVCLPRASLNIHGRTTALKSCLHSQLHYSRESCFVPVLTQH